MNGIQTEVLIVGGGIAGTVAALRLAQDSQREILMINRASVPEESNSRYAQGGIVSMGIDDSPELLVKDILEAGAGLCFPPAVELLATEGPRLLQEILIEFADVPFERDKDGNLQFGLEAAHSTERILHVQDRTGREIMAALHRKIKQMPNIKVLTNHTAVDLITFPHHSQNPLKIYDAPTCVGAYVLNQDTQEIEAVTAKHTILATGGLGQVFLNTTNPIGSRGDGLAMAYRAGAEIINAEYVQFHPTALYVAGPTRFLISEAVRGEGAVLLTPDGTPFMERYAPEWKDLAPRDVVARAIYWEMLENDYPYVLLDLASYQSREFIIERFPQIYENCLKENIDITVNPIPVVPAAHYFCGGIKVDLDGRSSLHGLYAVGEVACTGVHGANRLASTSLLEGLVWGQRAAQDILKGETAVEFDLDDVPAWSTAGLLYDPDPALIQGDLSTIRNLMWHYVGLSRNDYRLKRAVRDLRYLRFEIENFYRKTRLSDDLIGLRNAIQTASIITSAAVRNHQSMGCHYREDDSDG